MPDQKLGFALLTNISVSHLARGAIDEAIWTNLLDERASEANSNSNNNSSNSVMTSQPSVEFVAPFTVDELMIKMINAAGGEANLRRHKSRVTTAALDFEQQGMTGEAIVHVRAPNSWSESIKLFALGRKLGTTHEFFDGTNGGAEFSYYLSQKTIGDSLQDMKIASDFYPLLNWKMLFKTITIKGVSKIGDEDDCVVVTTPEKRTSVTEYVSTKPFLTLRREPASGIIETYGNYRTVDGSMMPFRIEMRVPGLGNIVYRINDIKFDRTAPEYIFRPGKNT